MIYLPRKRFHKLLHQCTTKSLLCRPAQPHPTTAIEKTLVKQLKYRHIHAGHWRRGAGCARQLRTASCAVLCSASLRCSAAHHRLQAT